MKARYFAVLLAAAAAVLVAVVIARLVLPEAPYEGGTITLIYTGDTYGQLESCG